jgi:hypothetical protein
MTTGSRETAEPTPVHRAIDRLTAALLEVQRLQLRVDGASPDVCISPEDWSHLVGVLQEVGEQLTELRDRDPAAVGMDYAGDLQNG